jgi:hypothetical protein
LQTNGYWTVALTLMLSTARHGENGQEKEKQALPS